MISSQRGAMLSGLEGRNNGIGFLRLFFASVVIWSHAFMLGGFGEDPVSRYTHGTMTAGFLAVGAFFVVSGFLIARSCEAAPSVWRFLWHRFLRIFPGYWVCLVVVAFVVAPLAYWHDADSLAGFLAQSPWRFVGGNAALQINAFLVGGTLKSAPYKLAIDGSLWTLQYEFVCYLAVALFGLLGVFKAKPNLVAASGLGIYLAVAIPAWGANSASSSPIFHAYGLYAFFAAGSFAYIVRNRLPMRWWLCAGSLVVLAVALPTPAQWALCPACVAYATLYASTIVPIKSFDRRVDLSYGTYIYAFAIMQILALCGLARLGFGAFFALSWLGALAAGAASWWLVERPALSLKNVSLVAPLGAPFAGSAPL